MSRRPVEESNDSDIIGSVAAMERAADRAWELAKLTSTKIVIEVDGKIVHVDPNISRIAFKNQELSG